MTEVAVEDVWWIGNCGITISPCLGAKVSCQDDRVNPCWFCERRCDAMMDCNACIANLKDTKNLGETYNYDSLKCQAQGADAYMQGEVCQLPGCSGLHF
mmetsp:Transcript_117686/g.251466  ORF Transcript_117686/g.251466 Transcript_117686/m.251466 type:complete len:99 (-) Transcript_117686:76-372(-)